MNKKLVKTSITYFNNEIVHDLCIRNFIQFIEFIPKKSLQSQITYNFIQLNMTELEIEKELWMPRNSQKK